MGFVLLGVALAGMNLKFIVLVRSESWRGNEDLNHVARFGGRGHAELDFFERVVIFFCKNNVCGDTCVLCFNGQERVSMVI